MKKGQEKVLSKFKIEDMKMEHICNVVEIEKLCFETPWSENDFINEFTENKYSRYRVILNENNKVISYGGFWELIDEAHITNIAVHPDYRKMGLGNMIMEDLISYTKRNNLKAMTLEVREGNIPARNLYKKYGFKDEGRRKGYYQDTKEDAIIMWKVLDI